MIKMKSTCRINSAYQNDFSVTTKSARLYTIRCKTHVKKKQKKRIIRGLIHMLMYDQKPSIDFFYMIRCKARAKKRPKMITEGEYTLWCRKQEYSLISRPLQFYCFALTSASESGRKKKALDKKKNQQKFN